MHEIMTEALTRIGFDTRSLGILCGLRKRSQQLLWLPWGDLSKPRSHASEKKKKKEEKPKQTCLLRARICQQSLTPYWEVDFW